MLSDSDFVEQFVEDHTEAAKTLRGIIQRIVNAINKAFKHWENRYYGKSWANELAEMKEENKVVEAWYSLLDKTIQKQKAGPQVRGTVQAQGRRAQTEAVQEQQETAEKPTEAERKTSLDMDEVRATKSGRYDKAAQFEEHKYFAGITGKMREQNPTGYTKVGEITEGSIYTRIGLPAGTTYFDNSKILKELNKKHDPLPVEYLKQVPKILAHPTVIVEARKENTVSVFGEIRTKAGTPILVGVMAARDRTGRNVITKIRTVHQRFADLSSLITDKSVLYITEDKKKAKDWFQASHINMPLGGTKFGFIRSITLSNDLVNRFSLDTDYMRLAEKYKAGTLTKEDESKLRKMVDDAARANGYTRRVYHGTPLETTSASRGRLTGKEYDKLATDYADKILPFTVVKSWIPGRKGTYTSTNRQVAEDFALLSTHGTTVFDLYAKTDRPLVLDAHDSSWKNLPHDVLEQAGVPITDNWGNGTVRIDDVVDYAHANGYDSLVVNNVRELLGEGDSSLSPLTNDVIVFTSEQLKSADPIVYDNEGNIIPLSERFKQDNDDIRYTFDTDAMRSGIREAFTQINGDNLHEAIDLMDNVLSVRAWAFKDVSRMMDALAGNNKDLRNTLHTLFEEPHSRATGNYANGIANLNRQLLDIGKRAGVFDEKGKNFDEKESAFLGKRNTKSEPAARRQRV